jgi:hypothetical protein
MIFASIGMQNVSVVSALLKPYNARMMRCYPVSDRANRVANDDAECSAPRQSLWLNHRLRPKREASILPHDNETPSFAWPGRNGSHNGILVLDFHSQRCKRSTRCTCSGRTFLIVSSMGLVA